MRQYDEKRQKRRLITAVFGSVGLLVFLGIFGVKILINFSLLADRMRGGSPVEKSQALLLPPFLNPLPEATKSADLRISGQGTPGKTLVLYLNENEAKKLTIPESGEFTISELIFLEGENVLSAKLVDESGNVSVLSNVVTTTIKNTPPILEISTPANNENVTGDSPKITVTGKTQEDTSVSINDRFVVVKSDGSFTHTVTLSEGENHLRITATDNAGNSITAERLVTYSK